MIIWRHLELIFFKLFRPRARLANVIDSVCQNCGHHNSDYSGDVSASYRLMLGNLPGWRAPQFGPAVLLRPVNHTVEKAGKRFDKFSL